MKQFMGFPARMQFTPLPNLFFSQLLPQIDDMNELKTTLHILWALYRKRGYPRFVTYNELLGDTSLVSSLKKATKAADEALMSPHMPIAPASSSLKKVAKAADEALGNALSMAAGRGTILHLTCDLDGKPEELYFLNTQSDRQAVAKIQSGKLKLPGLKARAQVNIEAEELPDIFTLYEENIGMLTPVSAEELKEAEKLYPETWIRDAIREAVNQNKRKWSYISVILERWSTEGRSYGTYKRGAEKEDPDKYIKGEYGHMVRRFGR